MVTVSYNRYIPTNIQELTSFTQSSLLKTASYLTDPLCKARESYVRLQALDDLSEASPKIKGLLLSAANLPFCSFLKEDGYDKWVESWYLKVALLGYGIISPITTPLGIALRSLTANLSYGPLHYTGSFPEKERTGNTFTHFFRNICGIKAGYDIEEGAQMPIKDDLDLAGNTRLDRLIEQIKEQDPDVLCLNEVYDINDAHYITNALKDRYAHFVLNCGPRSIGPSSGLFFATKFAASNVEFIPFPKEMLVENAKYCEKGALFVDIKDSQGKLATVALTHAQHSDAVRHGTNAEKQARADELKFIFDRISTKDRVILTGDLNMDDQEMQESQNAPIYNQFSKAYQYFSGDDEDFTWGGDLWYVGFGNRGNSLVRASDRKEPRKASTGCNLDHTMVKGLTKIETVLTKDPTPYDPNKISKDSLSDHRGLLSTITL